MSRHRFVTDRPETELDVTPLERLRGVPVGRMKAVGATLVVDGRVLAIAVSDGIARELADRWNGR